MDRDPSIFDTDEGANAIVPTRAARPGRPSRGSRRLARRPSERLRWRVIVDEPRDGARNMALDHALARHAGAGAAVLRLYGWRTPTVSFGRNETAAGRYSWPAARALGIECVRRPTGGRAVLHEAEVTYAVVAPEGALGGPREAYRRINVALAAGLRALGAAVEVADAGAALAPDAGPCFRAPTAGEVVAQGRKLVGSAQARLDGALLQHGSIVIAGDQSRLEALRVHGGATEPPGVEASASEDGPATLAGLLGGDVGSTAELARRVTDALRGSFDDVLGGWWEEGDFAPAELATATELEVGRYGSAEWTWRR